MLHNFYQNLPLHIDPIAFSIGSIDIRWYGLSYLVAFGVFYALLMYRVKRGEYIKVMDKKSLGEKKITPMTINRKDCRSLISDEGALFLDFLLVVFFFALIGGRVGYVILYDFSYFISNPLSIISPYLKGELVGIYGMSYHGGLVGVIVGGLLFLKIKKIDFFSWADFIVPAVSLGYFFGRIGNFLNGELYGRVTNSFMGMYFLDAGLRHPSQLYEAALEGILLFAILWKMRNFNLPRGTIFATYLIGYGAMRTFSEYFRQPDSQIGFIFEFLTVGQLLSILMILIGAGLYIVIFLKSLREK